MTRRATDTDRSGTPGGESSPTPVRVVVANPGLTTQTCISGPGSPVRNRLIGRAPPGGESSPTPVRVALANPDLTTQTCISGPGSLGRGGFRIQAST